MAASTLKDLLNLMLYKPEMPQSYSVIRKETKWIKRFVEH